jgi:hypothetical protein
VARAQKVDQNGNLALLLSKRGKGFVFFTEYYRKSRLKSHGFNRGMKGGVARHV